MQDLTGGNVLLGSNDKDRRGFIAKVGAAVAMYLESKGSACLESLDERVGTMPRALWLQMLLSLAAGVRFWPQQGCCG